MEENLDIRNTQRAPRSCFFCSRRKTKCDKLIPCHACRMRGQGSSCFVETVKVKGQVVTHASASMTQPSYSDLQEENARLRDLLEESSSARSTRPLSSLRLMDQQEQELYILLRTHYRPTGSFSASDVVHPPEDCQRIMLSYAADWAWVHSALSPTTIGNMNSEYSQRDFKHRSLSTSDASWLALYFSCLTIGITFADEALTLKAGISKDDLPFLRNNWYDAALYFLNKADFLRVLNVYNVQTIAVLGAVFVNFGDFNLYYNLLGCAVRIGESLGLSNDYTYMAEVLPDLRSQRRLWWALVILDWLNFPLGQPCLRDNDFVVDIPVASPATDSRVDEDSIEYQAMMSKMAQVLYRFQSTLASTQPHRSKINAVVQTADNQLANLIAGLPSYFQVLESPGIPIEMDDIEKVRRLNQRQHSSVILSYYRIVINRTSMKHSISLKDDRSTLVCLNSAHEIVKACQALANMRQFVPIWSILLPLYSAASLLIVYGTHCSCITNQRHATDITTSINLLELISPQSVYAGYAAQKLNEFMRNSSDGIEGYSFNRRARD